MLYSFHSNLMTTGLEIIKHSIEKIVVKVKIGAKVATKPEFVVSKKNIFLSHPEITKKMTRM